LCYTHVSCSASLPTLVDNPRPPPLLLLSLAMAEAGASRRVRKEKYVERLIEYLDAYKNILIVQVDHVGSSQMQKARIALRGRAVILMGKNTLMRKVIREKAEQNPQLETLVPLVYGNMGLIFTNDNLSEIRKIVLENKVPAAAKSGAFAPADVFIPPGPTGLDPGQTAFFQALNIATKIVKGAIELTAVVHLLKVGDRVTSSHVALLTKLNILPFFYGFQVTDVYENGTVYAAKILDMKQEDILNKFLFAVRKMAALSLAISYPTLASVPHIIAGAFSKVIALSLEADLEVKEAKVFKDFLANPEAFKAAAAAAAPTGGAAAETKAAEPEKEKEKSEESEADLGFSLFDD